MRAKILFDNLAKLCPDGSDTRGRRALEEFHEAVKAAVDALPEVAGS